MIKCCDQNYILKEYQQHIISNHAADEILCNYCNIKRKDYFSYKRHHISYHKNQAHNFALFSKQFQAANIDATKNHLLNVDSLFYSIFNNIDFNYLYSQFLLDIKLACKISATGMENLNDKLFNFINKIFDLLMVKHSF